MEYLVKMHEQLLNTFSDNSSTTAILPLLNDEPKNGVPIEPISTIEQLADFEEKLKNVEFVIAMVS